MKTNAIYLKLPATLSKTIDEITIKEGYASKQEYIREILRQSLIERRKRELTENLVFLKKKTKAKSPFLSKAEKDKILKAFAKEKGWKI